MALHTLNDSQLRALGPRLKAQPSHAEDWTSEYVVTDGGGLNVVVRLRLDGCVDRYFSFTYTSPVQVNAAGKARRVKIGMGRYPDLTLAAARQIAAGYRQEVASGVDPQLRKEADEARRVAEARRELVTFGKLAQGWLDAERPHWTSDTYEQHSARLALHVMPYLADMPISKIREKDVARVVARVLDRGSSSVAPRVRGLIREIFAYAVRQGDIQARDNLMRDDVELGGKDRHQERSHAAVTDVRIFADLLRDIHAYRGRGPIVSAALRLASMLAQRPAQLIGMRWAALDLDAGSWTVTGFDRKLPSAALAAEVPDFVVPLPQQAVAILREMRLLTGRGTYVFPGERARAKAMAPESLNKALRACGWRTQRENARDMRAHTAHGFRTSFQTISKDVFGEHVGQAADFQLGHAPKHSGSASDLGATYDRATLLDSRRVLVQLWADFCDDLRSGPQDDSQSWNGHIEAVKARYRGVSIIASAPASQRLRSVGGAA